MMNKTVRFFTVTQTGFSLWAVCSIASNVTISAYGVSSTTGLLVSGAIAFAVIAGIIIGYQLRAK